MATVYGLNATKRSVEVPSQKIDVSDQGGRVRVAYDEITPSALIPAADKIILGKLPKGARILYAKVYGDVSAGAADIGWDASADAVEAAAPLGIAAAQSLTAGAMIASADKKLAADVDIIATVTTGIAADGTVGVAVFYSLD